MANMIYNWSNLCNIH